MLNFLLANTNSPFKALSTVIMLLVVIVVMFVFGALFFYYYKSYTKCVQNNLENDKLKTNIVNENKGLFKKIEGVANDGTLSKQEKLNRDISVVDYFEKKDARKKRFKWLAITISCVVYAILIAVVALLLWFRINSEMVFIGGKTGVVVMTDSMASVYPGNNYINEYNLKNQFPAHSFIILEKIHSESDINLYDVVAYKDSENNTIIHRIVQIKVVDGVKLYTCRGDANNASASFELNMKANRFLGKYTGYQNYPLGVLLTFLRSEIGFITIATAFVAIGMFEFFEKKISVVVKEKNKEIAYDLDAEIKSTINSGERVNFLNAKNTAVEISPQIKTQVGAKQSKVNIETKPSTKTTASVNKKEFNFENSSGRPSWFGDFNKK